MIDIQRPPGSRLATAGGGRLRLEPPAASPWNTQLNVRADHVHIVCLIPPKLSVSEFVGLLKGKLAIKLFKSYPAMKKKPYWGNHFWARGYFVTTVGWTKT